MIIARRMNVRKKLLSHVKGVDKTYQWGGGMLYHLDDA